MKRLVVVVLFSLLLLVVTGCGTITGGFQPPQAQARVAFLRAPEPTPSAPQPRIAQPTVTVHVVNEDGTGEKQVGSAGYYIASDMSHDGQKVAIANYDDGRIYVSDLNGTMTAVSPAEQWAEMPEFSPDGAKVYYINTSASPWETWSVNVDATNSVSHTNTQGVCMHEVTVAPDGRLYFAGHGEGGHGIFRLNADGTVALLVDGNAYHPSTSPDGAKLVYELSADGSEIYIANIDGTSQAPLTSTGGNAEDPIVAGSKIFFRRFASNNYEIYSMNLDGTSQTPVTNTSANEAFGEIWD